MVSPEGVLQPVFRHHGCHGEPVTGIPADARGADCILGLQYGSHRSGRQGFDQEDKRVPRRRRLHDGDREQRADGARCFTQTWAKSWSDRLFAPFP